MSLLEAVNPSWLLSTSYIGSIEPIAFFVLPCLMYYRAESKLWPRMPAGAAQQDQYAVRARMVLL